MNTFSGCVTHILNFQDANTNFSIITEPIGLLQYLVFYRDVYVHPTDMSPVRSDNFGTWMRNINTTAFKRTRSIFVNNKTVTYSRSAGRPYLPSILTRNTFQV